MVKILNNPKAGCTIFTARASGIVGINTPNPLAIGLTVAGNISGSQTLQIQGVQTQSSYGDITPVGVTDNGLFKKSLGATTPVGGIILWSGADNAIPTGWAICDGTTVNGQATPNLVNRFVVGASDTYAVNATGGSKDAGVAGTNKNLPPYYALCYIMYVGS